MRLLISAALATVVVSAMFGALPVSAQRQDVKLDRPEAIRWLVELGLKAKGKRV